MSDQKERALAAFEQRKDYSRDQITEFALEVEFGDYAELIASHMLMMTDSARRHALEEKHSYSIADKSDRMITKVKKLYKGDDFSAKDAKAARAALLEAEDDAEALYAFVSCFSAEALQIFGI